MFLLEILLKSASKSSFSCFGVEIRLWSCNFRRRCAYFYCVLQLSLCRSHCGGCVAASRLLGAAAACVILLSFAAEHRKSYWSGCIQAAIAICQQILSILALVMFLLEILLKSASKSSFSCFGVEIRLWSCNFRRRCGQFYCVLQLSLCRSHCSGCVKVARCCGCMRNTIVFCSWRS